MDKFEIREMTIQDFEPVLALWQASEGIGLSDSDSRESIASFLERNPGLSFLARKGDLLLGAVLCGHDGRRGYIHHLAVNQSHRHQGIGKALVDYCLNSLKLAGIQKCHLFVFHDNYDAISFWMKCGWTKRIDLVVMSHYT